MTKDQTDAVEAMREALREIYEVWAGSEGMPCQTASEAYLHQLIVKMRDIAASTFPEQPLPADVPVDEAWQDISTAPKDGTRFLGHAMGVDGRPMINIISWNCKSHLFSSRPHSLHEDACDYQWLGEMGMGFGVEHTHWQPLPAPPSKP